MDKKLAAPAVTFNQRVAAAIRAEAARQGLTQSDICRSIGSGSSWLSIRWRGVVEWRTGDIERVAAALDIDPAALFAPRA